MSKESMGDEIEFDPTEEGLEHPNTSRRLPVWAHVAIGSVCGGLAAVPLAYGYIWYAGWELQNLIEPAVREFMGLAPTYSSRLLEALATQDRWVVEHSNEVYRNFVVGGTIVGAIGNVIYSRISGR